MWAPPHGQRRTDDRDARSIEAKRAQAADGQQRVGRCEDRES